MVMAVLVFENMQGVAAVLHAVGVWEEIGAWSVVHKMM